MESVANAFGPVLLAISVLGFGLLLAIQVFGRWLGSAERLGLILTSLVLEAFVFTMSAFGGGFEEGSLALWISGGILLWVIVAYLLFRIRLSQLVSKLPEGKLEYVAVELEGVCTPKLRVGNNTLTRGQEIGRFTGAGPIPPNSPISFLFYVFACQPSDSGLNQLAAAVGAEFNGLTYIAQFAIALNRLEMICLENLATGCEIFISATGRTVHQNGTVSVGIINSTQTSGNQAVVSVEMTATLSPSAAPLAANATMGTYIWRCVRGDA